jgi:hypothetical protein
MQFLNFYLIQHAVVSIFLKARLFLFQNKLQYDIGLFKVLTTEKRGGLAVVPFDRSRFNLFSRKFSNKLVQAPSCERPKNAPRTLFLSFAINNCFPTSDENFLAVFELVLGDFLRL